MLSSTSAPSVPCSESSSSLSTSAGDILLGSGSNLGIRSAWALQQQGTRDSPCFFKTLQTGDAKVRARPRGARCPVWPGSHRLYGFPALSTCAPLVWVTSHASSASGFWCFAGSIPISGYVGATFLGVKRTLLHQSSGMVR